MGAFSIARSEPFTVKINGDTVETTTLVPGEGDLNLDDRDGADVTNVAADGVVEVFAADGTLILSGTLQPK